MGTSDGQRERPWAGVMAITAAAASVLLSWGMALSATERNAWFFMVPQVDEVQMRALPHDPKFQSMSFDEKRVVVNELVIHKTRPVAEWVQEHAFDAAAQCEEFKSGRLETQARDILNVQRYRMSDEYRAEVQAWARERKAFRDLMLDILRAEKGEERQRKLLETLEAWDRSFGTSDARRDLAQLVENTRTREGRCAPASVVFPPSR